MADKKISQLTGATTPLAGTDVLPIVQSSTTKQVSVANLTAGRAVSASSLLLTGAPLPTASGGTNLTAFTANGVMYASSTSALATGSALTFDGTNFATTGTMSATKLIPTGGAVTGNGMWLPASNTVALSTNGTEVWRANSSQQLLVKATTNKTGGGLAANQGLGVQNDATAFASVEYGSGAAGTFTTITVSFTRNDASGSVIIETLMTGFASVYLDNVIGLYGNQTPVTMRNNASVGTSAALTLDVTNLICTLTITTSVIHPVIKVKCTVGGLATTTSLPTFTFA
jgi:hypothetical protein